jgi:hypothetical protein
MGVGKVMFGVVGVFAINPIQYCVSSSFFSFFGWGETESTW